MKKLYSALIAGALVFGMAGASHAFYLDFENGVDGGRVTDITGVSFLNYGGYAPLYADIRTGIYNATSDDLGISYGSGNYHMNGNFAVWAGTEADARGVRIDFTNDDGTWFQTGYSAYSTFYLEAHLTDGSTVSTAGAANLGSPMGHLSINATAGNYIDYIVLHDTGNFWIVDNMSGDATGVNPVPEPATMLLFGTGLVGLAGTRLRRKKQ